MMNVTMDLIEHARLEAEHRTGQCRATSTSSSSSTCDIPPVGAVERARSEKRHSRQFLD